MKLKNILIIIGSMLLLLRLLTISHHTNRFGEGAYYSYGTASILSSVIGLGLLLLVSSGRNKIDRIYK